MKKREYQKGEFCYRIYANSNTKGWQLIDKKADKTESLHLARSLNAELFNSYIVIEYNNKTDSDKPIDTGNIYKKCQVELVDYLDSKYGVEARAFQMKENQRKIEKEEKENER